MEVIDSHAYREDATASGRRGRTVFLGRAMVLQLLSAAVFVLSFAVYLATLAPAVTWGDSAKLATMTAPLVLTVEAGCHTLRNIIGVAFNLIPFGDVAYRQNIMSAFFGAVTCLLTFLIVRRLAMRVIRPPATEAGEEGREDSEKRTRGSSVVSDFLSPAASLAGLCAAVALCFSHVFWHVSVITESYTLFTALLAAIIFLIAKHSEDGRPVWLWLAGLLLGLSYMNSVLMFALTPALVVLVILGRRGLWDQPELQRPAMGHSEDVLCTWPTFAQFHPEGTLPTGKPDAPHLSAPCKEKGGSRRSLSTNWRTYIIAMLMVLVGYLPMIVIFVSMLGEEGNTPRRLLALLFDWRYAHSLFIYHPVECVKGCVKYGAVLFYQFPVLGFVLGCIGLVVCARRSWRLFVPLALIFAPIVLFTSTYMEQRRYYIMVGSFWVFAVWIGIGCGYTLEKYAREADISGRLRPGWIASGLAFVILLGALPATFYYNILSICRAFGFKPLGHVRSVAYRETEKFFLVPDKRGCDGAERFAREVFAIVPDGSVVIADFTPAAVLRYFQTVRGLRRDVRVVSPEGRDMLEYLDGLVASRHVFMVGGHPVYKEDAIGAKYLLVRAGPILQVVPR